jgi:DNA-binding GntR family transcriptional regulator
MLIKFFRVAGLIACFILIANYGNSQDLLRTYDLSSVKVDKLSDAEIAKFKQQLDASGLTEEQAEQIAVSKGMPVAEVQKLRVRLQNLPVKKPVQPNITTNPQGYFRYNYKP